MNTEMLRQIDELSLIRKGTRILFKELGYFDAIRFFTLPRVVREESVPRHKNWQATLDKNAFFDAVFAEKQNTDVS
jgi:hypothetical protein